MQKKYKVIRESFQEIGFCTQVCKRSSLKGETEYSEIYQQVTEDTEQVEPHLVLLGIENIQLFRKTGSS